MQKEKTPIEGRIAMLCSLSTKLWFPSAHQDPEDFPSRLASILPTFEHTEGGSGNRHLEDVATAAAEPKVSRRSALCRLLCTSGLVWRTENQGLITPWPL